MFAWSTRRTGHTAPGWARPWSFVRTAAAAATAAAALLLCAALPALAQENDATAPTAADTVVQTTTDETDSPDPSAAESVAPLPPMLAPQVGPLIKRTYADIIDRRTTAFLPTGPDDLAHLTAIEMPETDERWVRVDLSEQTLVAYQGATPIRAFLISSGLPDTPTVTGTFRVRMKVRSQLMSGGDPGMNNDYYLPNVEWVQYFYEDYGFHGTYWHNDFGRPKSHGCVNMTNADAKWLWDWLGPRYEEGGAVWQRSTDENPGSLVIVHD